MSWEVILPHAVPFGAVIARFSGLFLFAPLLGSLMIPLRVKALFIVAMSLCVYPTLEPSPLLGASPSSVGLIMLLATELFVGLVIGYIASAPIVFVQMGGLLMGQQMGLGIASLYNPALDTEGDVVGQILLYLALAIFLIIGGLEIMHLALVETFRTTPAGALISGEEPLRAALGAVTSGSAMAIRIAAPVMCIIFLETLATGLLMKTVPQLNILSFGFPLKILAGLFTLIVSIYAITSAIRVEILDILEMIEAWSLAPFGPGG